jgi:drug/metabolite transporter (DMT)-like permease
MPIHVWLPAAVFALAAWSVQRLLSKVALADLGTRKFYLLSAAVSLLTYAPYLAFRRPAVAELLPAFGLSCLMALTFGVTTEAIRRGPLGGVSPITALSPALTAVLAILVLGEKLATWSYAGIALAPAGVALLSAGRGVEARAGGWLWLAVASFALQGVGAFIAKLVVTPAGPSPLLLMSAAVQVVVGLVLAPPWKWSAHDLRGRAAVYTIVTYAVAAVATIGYLLALASGPAAVVVPLVATSPAVAGILGMVFLKEEGGRRRVAGIVVALAGAVLLSTG